ncbi:MAG: hypothetical protein ACR2K4_05605 [Candidatus Limnocylindria bacterium]
MTGSETDAAASPADAREAFRELHGPRLHGFALLLTLEDGPLAARLSADALAEAMRHVGKLRHPERAAAWLRASVLRATRRRRHRLGHPTARVPERVAWLNAGRPVVSGLSRLGSLERAALIAHVIERFDRDDVATIVGRRGAQLDRLLRSAHEKYIAAHVGTAHEVPAHEVPALPGPMVEAIRDTARRAMQ